MPGSFPNPIAIVAVKMIGYTIAGTVLRRVYNSKFNPFLFGGIRVAAGLIVGAVTLLTLGSISGTLATFLWLPTTRIVVWSALIWLLFEQREFSWKRFVPVVLFGTALSFALDGIVYLLTKSFPTLLEVPWC